MATTVSTVFNNFKAIIVATLPAEFQEIPYPREIEKNDARRLDKGYALRLLDGPFTDTLTQSYTIDQNFEILLTRTNPRQGDESQVESAELFLFDAATDILIEVINQKANTPGIVLKVDQPNFSAPELVRDSEFVLLRVGVTITYRQQLT
jgi:hypothetical protein